MLQLSESPVQKKMWKKVPYSIYSAQRHYFTVRCHSESLSQYDIYPSLSLFLIRIICHKTPFLRGVCSEFTGLEIRLGCPRNSVGTVFRRNCLLVGIVIKFIRNSEKWTSSQFRTFMILSCDKCQFSLILVFSCPCPYLHSWPCFYVHVPRFHVSMFPCLHVPCFHVKCFHVPCLCVSISLHMSPCFNVYKFLWASTCFHVIALCKQCVP